MPATSEPPPGSVIGERADQLAGQRRPHEPVDEVGVGRPPMMCGSAMPWVKSADISPTDAPAANIPSCRSVVSSRSPPCPPTSSGKPTPSTPCLAAARCSSRGRIAVVLPLLEVGHDLAAGELRAELVDRVAVVRRSSDEAFLDLDRAGADPLPEALGLRVEAGGGGHALAEQAADDDVDAAEVGQHVDVDRRGRRPRAPARGPCAG